MIVIVRALHRAKPMPEKSDIEGFDFRLTGFDSKASSLVCRLESLRIPLKARICTKATGSKKAARRGEVPLGFGTFDPASAQAGLSPHGRSVAARILISSKGVNILRLGLTVEVGMNSRQEARS